MDTLFIYLFAMEHRRGGPQFRSPQEVAAVTQQLDAVQNELGLSPPIVYSDVSPEFLTEQRDRQHIPDRRTHDNRLRDPAHWR